MKHNFYKVVICWITILVAMPAFAQDVIVTTDAKKIEAKIMEVSKTEIKYKEHDNLDGPTFIISTDEINSIIYKNGKVVLYNQAIETTTRETTKAAIKQEEQPTEKVSAEESYVTILLKSGNTQKGELVEMNSRYVAFIENGEKMTIPASEINMVSLANGQVRTYNNVSATEEKISTTAKKTEINKGGRIFRDNGYYYYNDTYISQKEVERIIKRENASAYNQWKKADGLLIGGSVCTGIAGGLILGGLFPLITRNYIATIGMECSAIVPLSIGLGLTLSASAHYNKAIDIYNSKYDQAAVQLRWGVSANGFGLALAF